MKTTDNMMVSIAKDYGLTDMNNRGGDAVIKGPQQGNQPFKADDFMARMMAGQVSGPGFADVNSFGGFQKIAPDMESSNSGMPDPVANGFVQPSPYGGMVPRANLENRSNPDDFKAVEKMASK